MASSRKRIQTGRSAVGPRKDALAPRDNIGLRKALAQDDDPYHHGALREALLRAAERLLERDGVQGLTLRAAAREAGVSHAAPKHHFSDLAGLLTELAIVGFERLRTFLLAGVRDDQPPRERLDAVGRGYVAFAKAHPALFLMMFRSERLDRKRPALSVAARAAFEVLAGALHSGEASAEQPLTMAQAGRLARAWSIVHGFSILLIDGRWKPLLDHLPVGADADALFEAVIESAPVRR